LITAGKQQCRAKTVGIKDKRTAITSTAERILTLALDFYLAVKMSQASAVSDGHVVDLDRSYLAGLKICCPTDFEYDLFGVYGGVSHTGQNAPPFQLPNVKLESGHERRDGAVHCIGALEVDRNEPRELCHGVGGILPSVELPRLQDRIAGVSVIFVSQDMVIRENHVAPVLSRADERTQGPGCDIEMANGAADQERPTTLLSPASLKFIEDPNVLDVRFAFGHVNDLSDLTTVPESRVLDPHRETIIVPGVESNAQGNAFRLNYPFYRCRLYPQTLRPNSADHGHKNLIRGLGFKSSHRLNIHFSPYT
jgi:hypothetical protein